MLRYLHTLSAICFYALGSSFFISYVLFANNIASSAMQTWLQIGTLPLTLCGLLYGGISVYRSIKDESSSTILLIGIALPLAIFFIFLLLLNFR
jgi:hypothetical protein